MSELKVGDNVFYKGDEGIIREVMMDGKENFYRVDVSKKSIHYLYEDELDLVTQKLNDNQKIVLEWLKSNGYSLKLPTLAINQLDRTTDMKVRKAQWQLNRKQEFEVLAAFARWGLEQEES